MVSHDFIGLLILGLFNVSIGRQQIRADLSYDVLASFSTLPLQLSTQPIRQQCMCSIYSLATAWTSQDADTH